MKTNIFKNYLFFWIDNLEFTVKDIKKDFVLYSELAVLDTDNTPRWYLDILWLHFSYTKIFAKWYDYGLKFDVSIDWKVIDCFSLLFWKELRLKKTSKSKDKVVFYSSFFVLERLWHLPFSLKDFFWCLFTSYKKQLYRLDIALDLPYTIKALKTGIFKNTNFFSEIGEDKKHPEFSQTYYIKNPQSSQNRKYIIRVYDKVLDTFKKQKSFLYPHLKHNVDVRRIELELRPIECQRYLYSITDFLENKDSIIQKIFINYLNKNIDEKIDDFDYKNLELTTYINSKYDLRGSYLELWHIPKDYLSQAHWYIKNIKNNTWYNWLFQLILWQLKNDEWQNINRNIWNGYDLLEELIIYLRKEWLSQSILNKILKKYIQKPMIKL